MPPIALKSTFDRITAINGHKVDRQIDLVDMLSANRGDTVVLTYLRPIDVPTALGGLCEIAVLEPHVVALTPLGKTGETTANDADTRAKSERGLLEPAPQWRRGLIFHNAGRQRFWSER